MGAGGGGLDDLLGQMLGGAGAPSGRGGAAPGGTGGGMGGGGLGDLLGQMMGGAPGGGGQSAQGSGLGDLLGGLLGGGQGARSAAGGGAMAMLGGLAMQALKAYMAQSAAAPQRFAAADAAALVDGEAERLALRAMLDAMKADGRIDAAEADKLNAKLAEDGVTADERAFVEAELRRPCDPSALAAEIRNPAQGAQIYAAALLAIAVDTEAERAYLRALAKALALPAESVAELHRATGAPAP
jgi:uncharacterized membrane protein YebE (DUF533 family)